MPLNKKDKKAIITKVNEKVKKCQTIVLAEYRGVSANSLTILRSKAREQKVYLRVMKNTLARLAFEGTKFSSLSGQMIGQLIYSMSKDAISAAKIINDFANSDDRLIIKSGSFDGKAMSKADVKELASIQSREELLSIILFVIQSPISNFARILNAFLVKENKEEIT